MARQLACAWLDQCLTEMPGMSETAAHRVLAEIGHDMSRFPTAGHLVSFAGLCPRLDESAGKRRSTRLRKGSNWLKAALVSCAWAAARSKNTYVRAQYHRIKTRRGSACSNSQPKGLAPMRNMWNRSSGI